MLPLYQAFHDAQSHVIHCQISRFFFIKCINISLKKSFKETFFLTWEHRNWTFSVRQNFKDAVLFSTIISQKFDIDGKYTQVQRRLVTLHCENENCRYVSFDIT